MRQRHLATLGALAVAIFVALAFSGASMVAQAPPSTAKPAPRAAATQPRPSPAAAARGPRTPWGHPDLQGAGS